MNEIQDYIVKKGEKIEIALRKLNTLPNEKILFVILILQKLRQKKLKNSYFLM